MRSVRARLLALATLVGLGLGGALQATGTSLGGVTPNRVNMLDCNGYSTQYHGVKPDLGGLCTDPIAVWNGYPDRFYDNGRYVGHDEPSVRFLSNAPGSGNTFSYDVTLPVDPSAAPTISRRAPIVSHEAELGPAIWFGLALCDPRSYPLDPCTPDSDRNGSGFKDPLAAGSAFMELQVYAPGFPPFVDAPSCSASHWCAALTIDSLECTYGFKYCNGACEEPVNFAFLQRNGVPAGPPSPQLSDVSTFTPNASTLLMNDGDQIQVGLSDGPGGLRATINDLTTHETGWIAASAANGFMDTGPIDCSGHPFTFHAEFSSSSASNGVPWAASEGDVTMATELGHFEPCASIRNPLPQQIQYQGGQSFVDASVSQSCVGGFEGTGGVGEGPCSLTTGNCQNATTQTGLPCPFPNVITARVPCEFSDALCMPKGPRAVVENGDLAKVSWPIAGCQDTYFQNGDLDFDGSSYVADWPDGSKDHPTSYEYIGPFSHGHGYPRIQFETDIGGSEAFCDTTSGRGCTAPPIGAAFYPYWSVGRSAGGRGSTEPAGTCAFDFGAVIPGTTVNSFHGDHEYGRPDVRRYGGTLISSPMANPELASHGCGAPTP